jgi:hypothetical protein
VYVIVGNKQDLIDQEQVTYDEARTVAAVIHHHIIPQEIRSTSEVNELQRKQRHLCTTNTIHPSRNSSKQSVIHSSPTIHPQKNQIRNSNRKKPSKRDPLYPTQRKKKNQVAAEVFWLPKLLLCFNNKIKHLILSLKQSDSPASPRSDWNNLRDFRLMCLGLRHHELITYSPSPTS